MSRLSLKSKIDKAFILDYEIKQKKKELTALKDDLKDEAFENGIYTLPGNSATAEFSENSKTIFITTPEIIYKNLRVKADILSIAQLSIPMARGFFSKNKFEKITKTTTDSHGKVSFKKKDRIR